MYAQVASERDFVGWTQAFIVLGVQRCQAAWHDLGLPAAIRADPDQVISAAESFFGAVTADPPTLPGFDEYVRGKGFTEADLEAYFDARQPHDQRERQAVDAARNWARLREREGLRLNLTRVRRAFGIIEAHYAHENAEALDRWARRHFVDRRRRRQWKQWGRVLCAAARNITDAGSSRPEAQRAFEVLDVLLRREGADAWEAAVTWFAEGSRHTGGSTRAQTLE